MPKALPLVLIALIAILAFHAIAGAGLLYRYYPAALAHDANAAMAQGCRPFTLTQTSAVVLECPFWIAP